MLNAKKIHQQIQRLTSDLINTGLCDDQSFPRLLSCPGKIEEVNCGRIDTTIFLKNVPYPDMYKILKVARAYNFKMIDGALILMQYRFQNNKIVSHRLSFFPSPDFYEFQNEPDMYLDDDIYADILDKRIVPVPLRFDYDNLTKRACPIEHPVSHLTLGQYGNCRIPVSSAVTPYHFISFIISNFYNTAYKKYRDMLSCFNEGFDDSIFIEEQEFIHVRSPLYRNHTMKIV